jgi:hypothetical protein
MRTQKKFLRSPVRGAFLKSGLFLPSAGAGIFALQAPPGLLSPHIRNTRLKEGLMKPVIRRPAGIARGSMRNPHLITVGVLAV